MTITVTCEKCGASYNVPDSRAGQTGGCKCGNLIKVPNPPTPIPPCRVDEHDWPMGWENWSRSSLSYDWPPCRKCDTKLLDFIDAKDIEKDSDMRFYYGIMKERHEAVFKFLCNYVEEQGISLGISSLSDLKLGFPETILSLPVGRDLLQSANDIKAVASIVWPMFRMVGWVLWAGGGTNAMRTVLQNYGQGISLDMIWSGIGTGSDMWQG